MNKLNLGEFRPIPNHPSYMIRRDGRVLSLRKSPAGLLTERPGSALVWRRVRFDGQDWRVRDLVSLVWGDIEALERRTEAEYEELWEQREARIEVAW